ncbi:MAG: sugar phosphate isomerase/epimerase family protein [Verrucomicrobiota bacterium]
MHPGISRRSFFESSSKAAVALAGIGLLENLASAIEPFQRGGKPRLLLSIAAYSFRDFFKSKDSAKELSLFQFIDYCAEQGCQGAELTSYYFPQPLTDDFLLQIRRHCFLRGIEISGTACGNNFALPKGEKLTEQINSVKKWIDHAAVMGAPHIRVFAGAAAKGLSDAEARKLCIGALEECSEYAGSKGIFLGLENHGGIVAKPEALLEIVKTVQSRWLGINLDTGNFHTADPYADIAQCAPYAVNVQLKAAMRPENEKTVLPADIKRIFNIMRDANYQGYVALEYEEEEDPWQAVPGLVKKMQTLAG